MTRFLKIFASYLVLVLLAIAVLDFFLTPRIRDIVTRDIEDSMASVARTIALMPVGVIESKMPEFTQQLNMRLTLIDPSGKIIADSSSDRKKMENHLDRPEIQQAKTEGYGKAVHYSVTLQKSMLYVALPIKENNEIRGYIRLSRLMVDVEASLNHMYRAIYLTLFIILLPSIILAFFFSRNIASRLTPVEKAFQKNRPEQK